LVFDPVGGSAFPQLARATANGGTLILYGALASDPTVVPPFEIFARDLTVRGLALPNLMRDDAQLAALKRFVGDGLADGTLRPTIARKLRLRPDRRRPSLHRGPAMRDGTGVAKRSHYGVTIPTILTTSKFDPATCRSSLTNASLFHLESGAPLIKQLLPLSATIIP